MLYKIIGGALIIAATTVFGCSKARALSERVNSLLRIKTALSVLESEIIFSANHMKRAFLRLADTVGPAFLFREAAARLEEDGVGKAWRDAVDKYRKKLCLADEDVRMLKTLSAELGMTDRENQVKNLRRVAALLDTALIKAREEYDRSARLYRSCGIMAGLLVVILLV